MRILIVVHGFPGGTPRSVGGAELYAEMHAAGFARGGDRVLVLTREQVPSRPDFSVRRETRDGVEIVWINNTFASSRSFADAYTDDRVDAIAGGVIDDFRPDVAHIHHLTCLSSTIVRELAHRNVAVFCTLHDYWLMCHRGQLLDRNLRLCPSPGSCDACLGPAATAPRAAFAARKWLKNVGRDFSPGLPTSADGPASESPVIVRANHMRSVLADVTHFFAPSAHLRDRFVAWGLDPARISVSEYGWALPGPVWSRPVPEPSKPVENRYVPLGFLGSLMVSKAPHVLLEACNEMARGSCVVHVFGDHVDYHGDASYRDTVDALMSRSWIWSYGAIDRSQLGEALSKIDVLVVPSVWPENSPLVIREAFLAGVPVVASRIGGIPEIVTDNVNGLLFTPGDAKDLRRVLRRLVDEPELLPKLRAGIPPVRTVDDDVRAMRAAYQAALDARTPAARKRLAAVVLNYRTPDDTFLAVRSLQVSRRPIDDIIVVNNDDDAAAGNVAGVEYLDAGANLGFSGGMNLGIRRALERGADLVLLVNSDVVVPVDCAAKLERGLEDTAGAGIAGPVVIGRSSPAQIASLGISYDHATGRMRHQHVGAAFAGGACAPARPDGISGCLMLVKKEVFAAVGELDQAYFFSFEDLDFCLRGRDAGFATIVVPSATVLHEGGRSMGTSPRRLYFGTRNHLRLARRRGGPGGTAGAAARSAYVITLNVAHAFRANGGSLPQRLTAVAAGARDYFRGRFGG